MADTRLVGSNQNLQQNPSGQFVHMGGSTAARLADEYNIDPRTVRRDARVAQEILRRAANVRSGKAKTHSSEELRKELGL